MNAIVVQPVRFTDRIAQMRAFLELIGLRPWISGDGGGWVDMACGGGRIALHDAALSVTGALPGQTSLSFEADDVTALAKQLTDAGIPAVTVYDEAYGRVLTCQDPTGDTIAVNERMNDFYGYQLHGPTGVPARLRVTPVRFTDPAGPYGGFLTALGLRPAGELNPYYLNFLADSGAQGQVGLHHVVSDTLPVVGGSGSAAVQLNFESAEPLELLAARLTGAGFPAEITTEDFGSFLTVTDPDGQQVQVHTPHPTP
jgi:hypothetical protein